MSVNDATGTNVDPVAGQFATLSRDGFAGLIWLLPDSSILGRLLHVLIGYTAKPTAMQLLAYLLTLATIITDAPFERLPPSRGASLAFQAAKIYCVSYPLLC